MNNFNIVWCDFTEQGEGYHWGRRALFVRMPFCNLKCSFCDTEFNSFTNWSRELFIKKILSEPCRFAVITGGEPMMNKQTPSIVEILKQNGYEIACETNGCFPIIEGIDFVTVSPKKESKYFIHSDAIKKCNEIKLVVDDAFDFSVLDYYEKLFNDNKYIRLTLSPEFNNMTKSFQMIEQYIKEHPRWQYSLQTHKFLGIK